MAKRRSPAAKLFRAEAAAIPIRPCSRRGLPCRPCRQERGALLPHRFTLTRDFGRFDFCGAFPEVALGGRYPPPFLRGARTFLAPRMARRGHPADRPFAVGPFGAPGQARWPLTVRSPMLCSSGSRLSGDRSQKKSRPCSHTRVIAPLPAPSLRRDAALRNARSDFQPPLQDLRSTSRYAGRLRPMQRRKTARRAS